MLLPSSRRKPINKKPTIFLCIFLFVFSSQYSWAQSFTIEDGQTVVTQQTLNNGDTGTIDTGGELNVPAGDAIAAPGDNITFTNDGTLSTSDMLGDGIEADGINATITNNGTINTTGLGSDGIDLDGDDGTVINTGTITTLGQQSEAIESDGANATIENSGSITTTGTGADGILSNGDNANITNSGTITISGDPQVADVSSGIQSTGADANITNSGSILVTGATGTGVDLDAGGTNNNTLTNTGLISATGGATQAIVGGAGEQTINLNRGSQIVGDIDLGGGNDTINFGANTSSTLTILNTENLNFNAGAIDGDTVFVVDPTGFAAIGTSVNALSNTIHQLIGQRLLQPQPLQPVQVASLKTSSGLSFQEQKPLAWASVFGEGRRRGSEDGLLGYEHDYYGFTAGYEFDISDSRVGIFAGLSEGDIETQSSDAFEADVSSYFFGAYGRKNLGSVNLSGSLLFGFEDYDSDREVFDASNGLETADADIDNFFISPSVTLSSAYSLGDKYEVRPALSLSYIYADFDSFSESGTTQSDLDVDDRTVEFFNTRLQLAGAYIFQKNSEVELRVGIDTRHASEDDVDATIGNNINFDFDVDGDEDVLGAFVGGRAQVLTQNNLSLSADTEYRFAEGDETDLSANIRLEYRFK